MGRLTAVLLLHLICVSRTPAEEANVNGFRMYYEVHGHGEPVVFIHGFSLDSRMWKQQRALQSKYRVIVADMRLHGRSQTPENAAYGLAEAAADVRGLLDHLGIDRAHVAGLSMGGMFALETALRYPERVRSLTLAASGIEGMPPSKESIARFMKGLELYKEKGATAFRANWLADPLFAQINKKPKPRQQIEEMVAAFQLDTFLKILSRPATPPSATQLQRLSEVKMPTLVMIGELDQPEIRAAADASVKAIPGARKIVYSGVGHIINMEQPKKFNRDLESFLRSMRNRQ